MAITELRILPPLAIGRLGSSPTPLEAYELAVSDANPLDYRRIVPRETLRINPATGAIAELYTPRCILFRDGPKIRPVAPFLEVYARIDGDDLVPPTLEPPFPARFRLWMQPVPMRWIPLERTL